MNIEEITPEALAVIETQWRQTEILNLTRSELINIGAELRQARWRQLELEIKTKLRVWKVYQLGFTVEEIADLLGLERKEIKQWTKNL